MDKSKSNGSNRVSTETRGSSKEAQTKEANRSEMQSSQLMKLFEEELKDIYWAEKALTKAIPKMIKNATSADLVEALENHLTETEEQVTRAEQVFELTGKKAVAKKCEAMEGLIKEAGEIMEECEEGAMCDAGIICRTESRTLRNCILRHVAPVCRNAWINRSRCIAGRNPE